MKHIGLSSGSTAVVCVLVALVCLKASFDCKPLAAQGPMPGIQAAMAVSGQPFGVLVVELPLPPTFHANGSEELRVMVNDSDGRVHYPATQVRTVEVKEPPAPLPGRLRPGGVVDRLRNVIRGEKSQRRPVAITVMALFQGEQPLELVIDGDITARLNLTPMPGTSRPGGEGTVNPAVSSPGRSLATSHAALLAQWWRGYGQQVEKARRLGDHPMLIHDYLANMLSSRLNLPWPPPSDEAETSSKPQKLAEPLGTLALLSGIEPLREEIQQQLFSRPVSDTLADQPLPAPAQWAATRLPPVPPEIQGEALATAVPPEFFYLRFGSFSNYLWFQDLSARSGGDLAQIMMVRGFNYETSRRMERMLNTRMTAVAKMFGDQIISDMAIIGRDLYMKEGASLGVLFASKNRSLLLSSMDSERKQAAGKNGITLQTVKIAGQDVSLLSAPDNSVRSFLVGAGDHVLLTTSRHIAERFLQVAQGEASLASLDSFRWARQWMPDTNNYSVFAYFSPEFLHGLVEPAYQVELRRRLEAIAHIEMATVAERAAVAEGIEPTVPAMMEAGLLPPWFDKRSDGSRTLISGGRWIDSRRGARGSFLPIVDVPVEQVTVAEAERVNKLTNFYQSQWQQMDPMLVGLRRFQGAADKLAERITLEAYVAPFEKDKYGWVGDLLAPAAPVAIALPADDVISVQALMNGTTPLTAPRQPYHLFAGVKDMIPPTPEEVKGLIQIFRVMKATPGYLGAFPQPGYLDRLPLGLGSGRPDLFGISRSIIGLYRWQEGGFSILSFNRMILESLRGLVSPMRVEDSAQVRLRIANLEGSQISSWINQQWYDRAWRASRGNASLTDTMTQQLRVPGPEALTAAQSVLDVKLNCPLGGQFTFQPAGADAFQPGANQPGPNQASTKEAAQNPSRGRWVSSAWSGSSVGPNGLALPPASYLAPWLQWFRGAQLHLTQFPDRLAVVGTVDVQRQPLPPEAAVAGEPSGLPSMSFDLFGLPSRLFGGGAKEPVEQQPKKKQF